MKLGTGPTMEEALGEIYRVGALVGGEAAARWARELREIAAALPEGKRHGPRGVTWRLEAARLKLAADVAEYGHNRRAALANAKVIAAKLPILAGKAADAADALEVEALRLDLATAVAGEVEQVALDPRTSKRAKLGGKAMADMDRATERRFCFFLEALGGRPADGRGTLGAEALLCDERTFHRGVELWYGVAEPETDAERVALERWRPQAMP